MKTWFANQSVALIGNAMSLFDKEYGKEIDEHDVVVRLNKAAMFYTNFDAAKSHGTRTDVWMFWAVAEYREFIKTVTCKTMHMAHVGRGYKSPKRIDFYYPIDMRDKIKRHAGNHHNPSTGMMALDYIYNCEPKSISIYGFDWKKTPTFTDPDLINEQRCFHDFPAEQSYCKKVYLSDKKVVLKE